MENGKQFISLLSDYGFKVVFADETNTLFLRKALQALIGSKTSIEEVQFLRNEFGGMTKEARGGILDLVCKDEKGRTFIVEMQLGYYKHFIHRAKFYAFQKFNTLVERGDYKFENLPPIYCIGFLAKGLFPESKEYYHFGRLMNQIGEELDEQITYIIVEINKFDKKEFQIQSDLDKLIFIMKNLQHIKGLDELPKFLTEDWIQIAMEKVDKSQMTPEQRMNYEMMMARNASIIEMMKEEKKQLREEVKQEVKEEVKEQVKEEVKEEVKEQVEQAAKETAKQTARVMKDNGESIELIMKYTSLSKEEIEQL